MRVLRWLLIAILACACRSSEDKAKVDTRFHSGSLGALAFPLTEGTADARAHFTRGLLALHSFWYDEARREFQAAIDSDRTMNMAYWGLAMSHCKLLWGEDDVDAAKAALKAMPDPERLSPREQGWVMATIELLKPGDAVTSRKRFVQSLEVLHEHFGDDETATFLSIALLSSSRPHDLDHLAIRQRAAELAAAVFAKNPKHPGAAHYFIHANDTPELATAALPYARAYAQIAPEAFHARHMPAHIFSRLGMWTEAIASCRAAWDASVAAATRSKLSANHHDFHSLNWLVEMHFELGRRSDADADLARFAAAVRTGLNRQHRALYATQVASFMMRTGEWARVDDLLAPLEAAPRDEATAVPSRTGEATHCAPAVASPDDLLEQLAVLEARARAAAMQHDVAKTTRIVGELDAVRAKLVPFLESTQPKDAVARIVAGHARSRRALLARAAADDAQLIEVLRESEPELDPSGENNPSGFSIHEEIADALMRMKQPAEAAAEYMRVLAKQPRRARSLLGAARAYAAAGDREAARRAYQELVELWSKADAKTDGLAEARAAIGARRD